MSTLSVLLLSVVAVVAAYRVPLGTVGPAAPALSSRSQNVAMQFQFPWDTKKAAPAAPVATSFASSKSSGSPYGMSKSDEELTKKALEDPSSLSPEELRRVKLELSTNWKPRTSTVAGEGYTFFQGPTPKTAQQEGMPDFFSAENFEGAVDELGTTQKVIFGLAAAGLLFLAVELITA